MASVRQTPVARSTAFEAFSSVLFDVSYRNDPEPQVQALAMSCARCVLEDVESASLPLDAFLRRLDACDTCTADSAPDTSPATRMLVRRLRESAEALARSEAAAARLDSLNRANAREIDAQVQATRKTARQINRLSSILESSTDFIALYDADLRPEFMNRTARHLLGIGATEDVSAWTMPQFRDPMHERFLREAIPHALAEGSWVGDCLLEMPGGRSVHLSQSLIAHRAHDGQIAFFSAIGRDISVYKEVDRMKSEFISTVSHELRTPLTAIRGSLGLLRGGVLGKMPEVMEEVVSIATDNADRLIRLINDILDLEKMEAGKLELHRESLRVYHLLESAMSGFFSFAEQQGVCFSTSCPDDLAVYGDHDRLTQVLVNLIGNALKFSPTGELIEVGAEPRPENLVRIWVKDHGAGIPQSKLERLFRKFSQLDASDRRAQGGSGLGLAISKAIVEEHGGKIGVASETGKGATFWFEVPREATRAEG